MSYNCYILEKYPILSYIFGFCTLLYFLYFVFFATYFAHEAVFAIDARCDYRDDGTAYIKFNYKRIDDYWRSVLESAISRGSPK